MLEACVSISGRTVTFAPNFFGNSSKDDIHSSHPLLAPWKRVLLEKLMGTSDGEEMSSILWNLSLNMGLHL
jgi:hypothetical protein